MDMFWYFRGWRKSRHFVLPSLGLRAIGLEAAPFSWIFDRAISPSFKDKTNIG